MNSIHDMILPTIIVGMLLTLILSVQIIMVESSVETRVTQDLQGFADVAVQVIQQDIRNLNQIVELTDTTIVFKERNGQTVSIRKNGRDLNVLRTMGSDTLSFHQHALRLSQVTFESVQMHGLSDVILRVRVQTESTPAEEVGVRTHRHRAFAHKDIYLRNLHLN
jgi:hypothetical protein